MLTLEQCAILAGVGLRTMRRWHSDPDEGLPSIYLSSETVRIPRRLFLAWCVEKMRRLGESTGDAVLRLNIQRRLAAMESFTQTVSPAR